MTNSLFSSWMARDVWKFDPFKAASIWPIVVARPAGWSQALGGVRDLINIFISGVKNRNEKEIMDNLWLILRFSLSYGFTHGVKAVIATLGGRRLPKTRRTRFILMNEKVSKNSACSTMFLCATMTGGIPLLYGSVMSGCIKKDHHTTIVRQSYDSVASR